MLTRMHAYTAPAFLVASMFAYTARAPVSFLTCYFHACMQARQPASQPARHGLHALPIYAGMPCLVLSFLTSNFICMQARQPASQHTVSQSASQASCHGARAPLVNTWLLPLISFLSSTRREVMLMIMMMMMIKGVMKMQRRSSCMMR